MAIKERLAAIGVTGVLATAGALIYPFEGEVQKVYKDPVGILTACIGHTSPDLRMGQYFTQEQCAALYVQDLRIAQKAVHRCIGTGLPEKTEAALISFALNVGEGNLCGSTLTKLAKRGELAKACQQLPKWVYADGVKLPGLITRRHAEMQLCLEGVYEVKPDTGNSNSWISFGPLPKPL